MLRVMAITSNRFLVHSHHLQVTLGKIPDVRHPRACMLPKLVQGTSSTIAKPKADSRTRMAHLPFFLRSV